MDTNNNKFLSLMSCFEGWGGEKEGLVFYSELAT